MKRKRKETKNTVSRHEIVITLMLITMIGLSIAGFIVPPTGVIDGSVLHCIALLCIPKVATEIRLAVQAGRSFSLKHGQTEISLDGGDDDAG